MKTRRALAMTSAILSVAVSLGATGAAQAKTVVTFWHCFSDIYGEGVRRLADSYNKSQKAVEIRPIAVIESTIAQSKLLSAMAAGSPPDIATFADLLVAEYAEKNLLLPLDTYMRGAGLKSSDFWKSAWGVTLYKGKQFAAPFTDENRALWYNKNSFKEVGLDPERPPKSLLELEEMAGKLFRSDGQKYTKAGFIPWNGNWYFYGWGWLFGGSFWDAKNQKVTANDPKNVEALDWLSKYTQRWGLSPLRNTAANMFNGGLAMCNEGNWFAGYLKKNSKIKVTDFGTAPVPPPEGRSLSSWSGVWSFVIPRSAKHPKEAFGFIKYALSREGQAAYAKLTSELPANREATKHAIAELSKMYGPSMQTFLDLKEYSEYRPTIPVGSLYWDQLEAGMWLTLNGKKTPRQSLDETTARVQKGLDMVLAKSKAGR